MSSGPLIAVAIAASYLALSGCGGGSSDRLSHHQLVRRAQAICLRAQAAAGAMLPPSGDAGRSGLAAYFQQSAAIAEVKTEELKLLKVRVGPAGRLEARWRRVLAAEEAFSAHLRSLGQAAASGEGGRLELIQRDTRPEQALIRSTKVLGVPLCAP